MRKTISKGGAVPGTVPGSANVATDVIKILYLFQVHGRTITM